MKHTYHFKFFKDKEAEANILMVMAVGIACAIQELQGGAPEGVIAVDCREDGNVVFFNVGPHQLQFLYEEIVGKGIGELVVDALDLEARVMLDSYLSMREIMMHAHKVGSLLPPGRA